jgi:hypothetical protein
VQGVTPFEGGRVSLCSTSWVCRILCSVQVADNSGSGAGAVAGVYGSLGNLTPPHPQAHADGRVQPDTPLDPHPPPSSPHTCTPASRQAGMPMCRCSSLHASNHSKGVGWIHVIDVRTQTKALMVTMASERRRAGDKWEEESRESQQ